MKQTKIVCSISDFRCDIDFLRKLFFSGMNVVRINTAHAPEEGIRKIVKIRAQFHLILLCLLIQKVLKFVQHQLLSR